MHEAPKNLFSPLLLKKKKKNVSNFRLFEHKTGSWKLQIENSQPLLMRTLTVNFQWAIMQMSIRLTTGLKFQPISEITLSISLSFEKKSTWSFSLPSVSVSWACCRSLLSHSTSAKWLPCNIIGARDLDCDKPFVGSGQSRVQTARSRSMFCCILIFTLQQRILVRFKFRAIEMGAPPHSSHFLFFKCVDSVSEWVLWPAGSAGGFYCCWRTHSWYNFPHVCLCRAKLFPAGFWINLLVFVLIQFIFWSNTISFIKNELCFLFGV